MLEKMIGESKLLQEIKILIRKVAPTNASVLILGESGTGKELVARALHGLSPQPQGRFVAINCSAIPSDLLESELFGHTRGAFTGAGQQRVGKIECADKGTLFLDEIGEMPLAMQAKLLRVLQEKSFSPVGSNEEKKVDLRIVAATNQDLEAKIQAGEFREDLFFRLHVFPIYMPALRNRQEDIPLLLQHFVKKQCRLKKTRFQLSQEVVTRLSKYHWPGNIRELENLVERLCILHANQLVLPDALPQSMLKHACIKRKEIVCLSESFSLSSHLHEVESRYIQQALEESDYVIQKAADTLGLKRTTLIEKMRKFNITRNHMNTH